jgi:hypothetical protein
LEIYIHENRQVQHDALSKLSAELGLRHTALIPSRRTLGGDVAGAGQAIDRSLMEPFAVGSVAVLVRCTAPGSACEVNGLELPRGVPH